MSNTVQVDSLVASEFELHLEGSAVDGIFGVHNLVTYATDENGSRIKPHFSVSKMVQRDGNNPMNKWLRETMSARNGDEHPKRELTVVAVDDGVVTRKWVAKDAWISRVTYSDFDNASYEMIAETFYIGYEDIEEEWPATENLE